MTRAACGTREVVDVCIVLFASITFASTSIVLHLIDGLYALLVLCRNQPFTETLVNTVFLMLVVLLWLTYRRWRKAQETIEHLLHRDDLTGLYNRRSFVSLAQQHLDFVRGTHAKLALFFIDLDGMKQINDTFGHQEGDRALVEIAGILKQSFAHSSIIGRFGGDEFVVLVVGCPTGEPEFLSRQLQENLDAYNRNHSCPYGLSVSIGVVFCDRDLPSSVEQLLRRADARLYDQKRVKNGSGASPRTGTSVDEKRPRVMLGLEAITS